MFMVSQIITFMVKNYYIHGCYYIYRWYKACVVVKKKLRASNWRNNITGEEPTTPFKTKKCPAIQGQHNVVLAWFIVTHCLERVTFSIKRQIIQVIKTKWLIHHPKQLSIHNLGLVGSTVGGITRWGGPLRRLSDKGNTGWVITKDTLRREGRSLLNALLWTLP